MSIDQEVKRDIWLPHAGIVLLMGPSNSGKTTLLQKLVEERVLLPTEVISSDQFRMLVGDTDYYDWRNRPKNEADVIYYDYKMITEKAFSAMETILGMRCRLGKVTVVDATHLHAGEREKYREMARRAHVNAVVIALDISEETLLDRDASRENPRGRQRVRQQYQQFKRALRGLREEGFDSCYVIKENQLAAIHFKRKANPLLVEIGTGIDIIGDIHGCYQEMIELIEKLGYKADETGYYRHPEGRKLVSVGDVMSRGPESLHAMRFWMKHVEMGLAYMVDSNHGWKIARYLDGRPVELSHGDERVAEELDRYKKEAGKQAADRLIEELKRFLLLAPSHLVFCRNGVRQVVVAHAGIRDHFIGKQSNRIQDYCRYGETEGQDEQGRPIRTEWYLGHESNELIIWGHDPRPQPTIVKNTINIDQGVVFGGQLTAYRFPEETFVYVRAKSDYVNDPSDPLKRWEKKRFAPPNLRKFVNGFSVLTEAYGEIEIRAELAKAAIDTLSHFTIPLEKLVYIPPTMSPPPLISSDERYLEHPADAFAYYRQHGVTTMVAEKKHMGSRAILLLFKDEQKAIEFVGRATMGTIYTRTGRAFFDPAMEREILRKLQDDFKRANYFERNQTDFLLLDAEIVPWNLKARELIASQYAHVAEAALMDRAKIVEKLRKAELSGRNVREWLQEMEQKLANAQSFQRTFEHYCWDVEGMNGIKIAPFHTLAHSSVAFFDKSHLWHMEKNREYALLSDLFMETDYRVITDQASEEETIRWWEELTQEGHEGIVVKPDIFITKHKERLVQPAIKVRGPKYLQIIYGMDYLEPNNLQRLKQRKTGKKERHALMEFALGVEAVQRFLRKEPLEYMHECVLAALSLESDPVDPRL